MDRCNIRKHGVSFDEMAMFQDPLASSRRWKSHGERREIILGRLRDRRLILVVLCEPSEDRIRIISARPGPPERRKGITNTQDDDLLPEYEFDYGKAQPNRFAERTAVAVTLQDRY